MRRTLVRSADTYCFKRHVKKLFTISLGVTDRLTRWNGVSSEVLHPPPPPRAYRCDGYGDYLFFASRLTPLKRADLVLRALADPAARNVKLVIGGEGEEQPALERLAGELQVGNRVTFAGRLTDDELVDHLGRCRAVVFVPKNEDYGFVTVEAFASGKAVITCRDSGGPTELVRSGENGLVAESTPASLARACADLIDNPRMAEQLGARGRDDVRSLTWANVVRKLVLT